MPSFYEVKVVDRAGAVLATFDGGGTTPQAATVEQVSWVLNEPGSATIRVPLFHASASTIGKGLPNEVQIYRDGVLIFWGIWLQASYDASSQSMVWTCPGLLWYFTRRYFGPVNVNYLLNPNFTTDLASWTASGAVASHSTAIRLRGPGTARLVSTASADNYLAQSFSITTGSVGVFLAIAALYWIDPATTFTAPAFEERGIYVQSAAGLPDSTAKWEPLNMAAPVGTVQRVETGIQLVASTTATVNVRLYSPHAAIHWGATSATALESVSSQPEGTDITEMLRRIVDYAQNGAGKSNVNILTSTPAAGTKEIVAYQFAELGNIFEAMASYPARGLADFEVINTSPTVRTFTTFAPRRGSLKSSYGLTVPGSGVLSLGYRVDGQQTSSKTIRRSSASGSVGGSDREVGVSTDTAGLSGLILEDVADAPPEVTVDGLGAYAATELARVKDVVSVPDCTVTASSWLGNVVVGDTVPMSIVWGAITDPSTRRVVRLTLNGPEDTVAVGVQVA